MNEFLLGSVAVFCGCALTGWILYLRRFPMVTRKEYEELVKNHNVVATKLSQYLASRVGK